MVLTDEQLAYARKDVVYSHKLEAPLRAELEIARLQEVFELEMSLIPIVVAREHHGFAIDSVRLEELRDGAAAEVGRLVPQLREVLNLPALNPDSPDQLPAALRDAGFDIEKYQ